MTFYDPMTNFLPVYKSWLAILILSNLTMIWRYHGSRISVPGNLCLQIGLAYLLMSCRLIKHTVEGIRTKLDRIYLHSLQNSATSQEPDSQETTDLQEELESLYSEILPVAQMSAEQQFLQPALKAIAATDGQGQERAAIAVEYVCRPSNISTQS